MVDVLPLGAGDLSAFFGLPAGIYPPGPVLTRLLLEQCGLLQPDFHPVLEHVDYQLFLAWEGQQPLGRIAAFVDTRYPDPAVGFFGLFEVHRHREAAGTLLRAAADWLSGRGKTVMLGPLHWTTNEKVGALIEGFDQLPEPSLPFNPPYYRELLEGAGLSKEIDLLAYRWDLSGGDTDKVARVAQRARRRLPGLAIRRLNQEDIATIAGAVVAVFNSCLKGTWGFVPLTERELTAFLRKLTAAGGIGLLAGTSTGPSGISLSVPSGPGVFSPAGSIPAFRLAVFGVIPEYWNRGLGAVLIQETLAVYQKTGCRRVEFSLVAENNTLMNRMVALSGAAVTRRCRVYRLALDRG